MTIIICTVILIVAVVYVVAYYDWSKWLAAGVLGLFAITSLFLFFEGKSDALSEDLKCDRMHGVLIKQQGETSCVERDSIKPIDLDRVFNN